MTAELAELSKGPRTTDFIDTVPWLRSVCAALETSPIASEPGVRSLWQALQSVLEGRPQSLEEARALQLGVLLDLQRGTAALIAALIRGLLDLRDRLPAGISPSAQGEDARADIERLVLGLAAAYERVVEGEPPESE